jgi:hypothetical protein
MSVLCKQESCHSHESGNLELIDSRLHENDILGIFHKITHKQACLKIRNTKTVR